MDKRQSEALIRRAVKAFRQSSPYFERIMDDASINLSDEEWEQLEQRLNETQNMPSLPESPEMVQARLEATVKRLKHELEEAEKRLHAFYAQHPGRKR